MTTSQDDHPPAQIPPELQLSTNVTDLKLSERESGINATTVINSSLTTPRQPPRSLWWWLGLLVLVKLALTANEEILASFLPHDDLWQVRASFRGYWGGPYTTDRLFHLPIYPLFMEAVRLLGLPLRLATELVYCLAACYLALSLWRIRMPAAVAGMIALAAIFHPASFQLPNRCGAEILLAPLLMSAIAASLVWWSTRSANAWWPALVAAGFWALTWTTRKESIVLLPILAALALGVILCDRATGKMTVLRRLALGIGLPLLACLLLITAIRSVNALRWGLYTDSILTAPGYQAAFKALQRIRPDHPLDYIPIPVEVRLKAYATSPAFAELQPHLEGEVGAAWATHSKQWTEGKGLRNLDAREISAGWFYWALYDSAVRAGHGSTPWECDSFFRQIADEINTAIDADRLPSRFVPIAMVDPAISRWAPRLPDSLRIVAQTLINPSVPNRPREDPAVQQTVGAEFDRAANRRANLIVIPSARIEGWVIAEGQRITALSLIATNGTTLATTTPDLPRPDVAPGKDPGFRLSARLASFTEWKSATLRVTLASGATIQWPMHTLPIGQVIHGIAGETPTHLAIDAATPPQDGMRRTWRIESVWEQIYLGALRWLQWPALVAVFLVPLTSIYLRRSMNNSTLAIGLFTTAIASRLALFTLLDANAWDGNQPRYLFAIMPLHATLVVIGWYLLVDGGRQLIANWIQGRTA